MIKISVNETAMEVEETTTISKLLAKIKSPSEGIAFAINNSIIRKEQWNSHGFNSNDQVLIIQATQGG
ncbi:sulfur carrier protein ThiS [Flavivirga rizhaonensis]|uniref:Sulfur carrier protein ThiS n=1 Tax=Flavivirga rizhaonensis TaxID=2559571 RepID=A0A4S1DST6_9FLAO|nr:sulfur carrier protein ThiS [Flavivirga rizhaonensis]TGV01051.1 sulfur carrier protein ThiS [Flavivirga rizhaonensis]